MAFRRLCQVRSIHTWAIAATLGATVSLAACGGQGGDETAPATAPATTPSISDFPRPGGKTIAELRADVGPGGPILAPSVSVLEPDRKNRFSFGLFDRSRAQITGARAAVYLAPVGGGRVRGPFPARSESLAVKSQFESRSTAGDPDAAKSVYVADVSIGDPGEYEVLGVVSLDDRVVATDSVSAPMLVDRKDPVPDVGDPAPRISTPTFASVGGNLEEIDTRVPPARELHEVDFADVLGNQPAVLTFATPQLCTSRVCGPVVDVVLEASATAPENVAFIHQEIFNDNRFDGGYRQQVTDFGLRTEPWTFVVDADGRIAARFEGAFSADELERAVDDVS